MRAFTIEPLRSGFTDELLQFAALYRLGISLGYAYHHTPFGTDWTAGSRRSGSRSLRERLSGVRWRGFSKGFGAVPTACEFVGFNEYFEARGLLRERADVDAVHVPLSDQILAAEGVATLDELRGYVSRAAGQAKGLIRLQLVQSRNFFETLFDAIPEFPDGLDLRAAYWAARRRAPWPSAYPDGRLKILVHLRMGDLAVVETPWGSYLPLWPEGDHAFREFGSFETIPIHRLLRVKHFERFSARLSRKLKIPHFTLVSSDGFARTFRVLERNRERLDLSEARWSALMRSEAGYERGQFERFADLDSCRLNVGESPRGMCTLIQSALEADVVVLGGHQRFLAKLFTAYCTPETMPLVLVLHRGGRFGRDFTQYYHFCGLGRRLESFLPVDLRNPDFPAILEAIERGRSRKRN